MVFIFYTMMRLIIAFHKQALKKGKKMNYYISKLAKFE